MESFWTSNSINTTNISSLLTENNVSLDIYFDQSFNESNKSFNGREKNPLLYVADELMKQKIDFGSTYEQIKRNITLINNQPGSRVKVPALSSVRKMCNKRFEIQYLVECDKFREYTLDGWCAECVHCTLRSESNYIIYIPLKQQIQFISTRLLDFWIKNHALNIQRIFTVDLLSIMPKKLTPIP